MIKGLTTEQAVNALLFDPDIYEGLTEAEKSTWRAYRKRVKEGRLSTDKMEELLTEYGFKIVQEKLWTK